MPTMFVSKCYKTKHFGQDSLFHKKPKLGRKITIFTVLKCGKGRNPMKTTIWATIIENVVRKGRKKPILDPKCARFPSENANLTNGTHFTHKRGRLSRISIPTSSQSLHLSLRSLIFNPRSLKISISIENFQSEIGRLKVSDSLLSEILNFSQSFALWVSVGTCKHHKSKCSGSNH